MTDAKEKAVDKLDEAVDSFRGALHRMKDDEFDAAVSHMEEAQGCLSDAVDAIEGDEK